MPLPIVSAKLHQWEYLLARVNIAAFLIATPFCLSSAYFFFLFSRSWDNSEYSSSVPDLIKYLRNRLSIHILTYFMEYFLGIFVKWHNDSHKKQWKTTGTFTCYKHFTFWELSVHLLLIFLWVNPNVPCILGHLQLLQTRHRECQLHHPRFLHSLVIQQQLSKVQCRAPVSANEKLVFLTFQYLFCRR